MHPLSNCCWSAEGSDSGHPLNLRLVLTHEEIAEMIGTSRERRRATDLSQKTSLARSRLQVANHGSMSDSAILRVSRNNPVHIGSFDTDRLIEICGSSIGKGFYLLAASRAPRRHTD